MLVAKYRWGADCPLWMILMRDVSQPFIIPGTNGKACHDDSPAGRDRMIFCWQREGVTQQGRIGSVSVSCLMGHYLGV